MLVFVNTLKLLRVVRFSKTIAKFIALPGAMKSGLIGFSVTSAIAFMAFSSSEILEANPYVGPVYFTFFMVFIYIILVNFLVTIICDAIASDASIDDDYDQELADYIWKSLHQIFGIHPPPTSHVKTGEESLTELNANLRMIEESLDDTLDVARSIWPANTSDEPSFNLQGQHAASSFLPTKQLDTYESANEVVKPSTSAMSVVYDQVKSVLETHEADAARLEEVQMESRRRARATVQRKLAARRFIKKAGRGGKRLGTIVEKAEVLLEQHAADTARLEHQHKSNRLLVESKVRQKLAARRMVKDNKK
uniref:Polycystin cation channel PKD1/PKD2 domain-containing protein n=1 Tax=Branchiostoma floridae TaxID=7739 RepID=C3YB41_BRAFL|eukprot:XP_002606493.1 hypothetical protein BRAFLDRAFT_91925 [Branchiostoma floridae]